MLKAEARFIGRTELRPAPHRIRRKRIVLATGSRPTAPPIPGLSDVPYFTNETIFANRALPDHLIVIGGGPIGLEMAQAHPAARRQGHGAGSRRLPAPRTIPSFPPSSWRASGPKASTCARPSRSPGSNERLPASP